MFYRSCLRGVLGIALGTMAVFATEPPDTPQKDPPLHPKTPAPSEKGVTPVRAKRVRQFQPFVPTTDEEVAMVKEKGMPPPWQHYAGQSWVPDVTVDGIVVNVSDEGIEICKAGAKESTKYPAHELLATGKVVHWESDGHCYLLNDVKKGDVVLLGVGTVDENVGEVCFYVSIRKRPGEKVPASRKPSIRTEPYHVYQQRKNEREEKGQPETVKDPGDKGRARAMKGLPALPPPSPPMDDPKKKD